jgi:ribosomal protein L16/L10AE
MSYSDNVRARIAAAELETARAVVLRMIRRAGRSIVWRYARKHLIIDFNDTLVTQNQRDFRDNAITNAQTRAVDANNATTVDELLIIFDDIAKHL